MPMRKWCTFYATVQSMKLGICWFNDILISNLYFMLSRRVVNFGYRIYFLHIKKKKTCD